MLAKKVYRLFLRLYPERHRRVYGAPMLQHAGDLERYAQQRGRWYLTTMWLRLLKDGILNAGIEHMEAIMSANKSFQPAPWLIVLLACIPGLLLALS